MAKKIAFFLLAIVLFSLILLPFPSSCLADSPALLTFATEPLQIQTKTGKSYAFTVEIAESSAQMQQGLMFREHLAKNSGMLFLPGKERHMAMWMKNTLVPLDMLFISRDGVVVAVAESTVPESLTRIASPQPVFAVLELNGGMAKKYGIMVGDKVVHRAFGSAQPRKSP